ncbi:MAG: 30S ribosomal protein S13 [Candidatus Harrisonbacteria bacterium CG10_big_fil_rev_8_21_14_0_10_45_28]|uniref:Small ribosomal subunit protein uS13 n=1 Tax=Candidatus Harrisonbacteria bacterium CG10_big_fil_rev_8_21_14_0_10_45_28 TaxID=1974586 RepID=A0A2H0UMX6_9BACT|nr:MAG: 30S ribosomal protein S13 [Candidatus Harrisonbacteria bacterium CG10_big_fil_rev_8_21_14_0_10_45_28]
MRIAGINIPDEKRAEIALTYIYGVGLTRSKEILAATKIDPNKRAKDLEAGEVNAIKEYLDQKFKVEGELRSQIKQSILLLKDLGSYRGSRHARSLPARGQRTKTNSRTVRGNTRKTAGSGKRKVDLK